MPLRIPTVGAGSCRSLTSCLAITLRLRTLPLNITPEPAILTSGVLDADGSPVIGKFFVHFENAVDDAGETEAR
jgi:hypothetical protein